MTGEDEFPPALDAKCGDYLTYRDFIECSDTWKLASQRGVNIPNLPAHRDTYDAMCALCRYVLDPVIVRFGGIQLTYGFASPDLDKEVRARAKAESRLPNTTRNGDQHAGCELNDRGKLYCDRRGHYRSSALTQVPISQLSSSR